MVRRWRAPEVVVWIAFAAGALYLTRLSYAPIYLIHDEVKFSLQAQAIAKSGRDLNGRLLPLYFAEPEFKAGRDPVMIYVTALALEVLPLSQFSVRLPTALIGVLNCVLMFLVSRNLFKSDRLGLIAAGLLALTPGHFIHSRMALSILYPIPFVLAWLWCLNRFLENGSRRALIGAGAWLGASIYSYLGSVVMAPVYLVFTIGVVVHRHGLRNWSRAVPAIAAFAVLLLPCIAWQIAHPERLAELMGGYRVPGTGDTLGTSLATMLSANGVRMRIGLLWNFFSPSFLFIAGDSSLVNSTRAIGFFPIVFAVLMPIGLFQICRRQGWPISLAIAGGFLTAPLAAVLSGELEANRILYVLPFGVLVATYGAHALLESRQPALRWVTAVLLIAIPLQFGFFYADYIGSYRTRTSFWFGGNLPDALTSVVQRSPQAVLLSREIPYVDAYWRFYAIAGGRPDLIDRVSYVDGSTVPSASSGALIVCAVGPKSCEAIRASSDWTLATTSSEPNGDKLFEVYERR